MRLADLDRDMSAVFPLGLDRDSEFLYARMAEVSYASLCAGEGDRVVDAAGGLGSDCQQLAERGVYATNVEPSVRINALRDVIAERQGWKDLGERVTTVRAWAETLPFRDATFRGALCKGSLDHFDDPGAGIAEMARVTEDDGRVVLAVVNMNALGCRLQSLRDRLHPGRRLRNAARRHYDTPPDHYTRFELPLLREQASRHLHVVHLQGVSLLWGVNTWARLLGLLPARVAGLALRATDAVARRIPSLADVIVISGRPRR